MAHAVVRTDRMAGTDVRSELVSIQHIVDGEQVAIDNGHVLMQDGLYDGKREIYKGVEPTADATLNKMVLCATPEVTYDERERNLDDFYNEVGKTIRGYHLVHNDIFSVTIEALEATGTPAVGDEVFVKAGSTKLSVGSGDLKIGSIIDVNVTKRYTYYAIEID